MYLSKKKLWLNYSFAAAISFALLLSFLLLTYSLRATNASTFYIFQAINLFVCLNVFRILTKKMRERQGMLKREFPQEWRDILLRDVAFYRALPADEQRRFEVELMIFLHEVRITGVNTEIDDRTMLLAAASAEIPVFSFPEWEYPNLGEILIYPRAFNRAFQTEGEGRNIWGMVGNGPLQDIMILVQPALIAGFENNKDKINVGIHEFAHLLDGADGSIDGIPRAFLENRYIEPWLEVMRYEIQRIEAGKSKMNPYGASNPMEFFAVSTEYFFEHPESLKKNKPELYALLQKVFQQDTKSLFRTNLRNLMSYTGKKIGRNSPCPCQSGKKYKNCCLRNARMLDADPMQQ